MIAKRSTISAVSLLALASCATPVPAILQAAASRPAENGYVMFSIKATGPEATINGMCLELHLRGISDAVTRKVSHCMADRLLPHGTAAARSRAAANVMGENDPIGTMVLIELPPGKYEFDDYEGALASFDSPVRYSSPPGFEYEFDVDPATINYLGDLNFALRRQSRSPVIGDTTPASPVGVSFQVLDQQDRDAPLFDRRFPAYSQKEKIWCDGCALHNP